MVKDVNTAAQIKKKRKAAAIDENDPDIYQKVCEYEEQEAKKRNVNEDTKLFHNSVGTIFELLTRAHKVKIEELKEPSNQSDKLVSTLHEVVVQLCFIKNINRIDKLIHVAERDALTAEKQKSDSIKLNYRNLVYELIHLVKETNKCLSFKSEDENIELVSIEEFMATAPEKETSQFQNLDPDDSQQAHLLQLARLDWELNQRKTLAEKCKELEEEKKNIIESINERKEKLDALFPLLNTVIKACKPLQEHLGVPMDSTRKEHALAKYLPDPLYILYANVVAYKDVYETTWDGVIVGDKDDAIQFNEAQEVANSNGLNEDDSEPEFDLPEIEEVVEVKKRRHRKSTQQVDPLEEKKKKLLEVHPLKIELSLSIPEGPKLVVSFSYYTKLKLVTISSKVDFLSNITANTAREILSGHNILSELVDNDTGLDSPNPGTAYLLKKTGLGSFQILIPDIGYAYGWAQSICGINFLSSKRFCEKLSQRSVQSLLKIIKKRLENRTHLAKQMQQLEQNILPAIPDSVETPLGHVSNISKWTSITYQSFCQALNSQPLIDEEFVTPSDLLYNTKIVRGEATLHAFIAIKNTYPVPAPIFVLNLIYKGNKYNTDNCDEIRDMERMLNVDWNENSASAPWLLSAQLTYVCSFLDIFLETLDPKVFTPNTKFIRSVSGRNRKRPFMFRKVGSGIFTQY